MSLHLEHLLDWFGELQMPTIINFVEPKYQLHKIFDIISSWSKRKTKQFGRNICVDN